jgi:hypothetical protein
MSDNSLIFRRMVEQSTLGSTCAASDASPTCADDAFSSNGWMGASQDDRRDAPLVSMRSSITSGSRWADVRLRA